MSTPFYVDPSVNADLAKTAGAIDADPTPTDALPEKIPFVKADGTLDYISPVEAAMERLAGGHVPSLEEEGKIKLTDEVKKQFEASPIMGRLSAAGVGLAKDVPFGIDALKSLYSETQGVTPEEAGRQFAGATAAYPGAEFLGSAGGFLEGGGVGSLLSGAGKAAASGVERFVGNSLLGRGAQFVAKNSVEGGLVGMTMAQNEDSVANHELSAEDLLHGGVAGMVMQNGLAIPLGLAGKAMRALRPAEIDHAVEGAALGKTPEQVRFEQHKAALNRAVPGMEPAYVPPDVVAPLKDRNVVQKIINKGAGYSADISGGNLEEALQLGDLQEQGAVLRDMSAKHDQIIDRGSRNADEIMKRIATESGDVQSMIHGDDREEAMSKLLEGTKVADGVSDAAFDTRTMLNELITDLEAGAETAPRLRSRIKELRNIGSQIHAMQAEAEVTGDAALYQRSIGRTKKVMQDFLKDSPSLRSYEDSKALVDKLVPKVNGFENAIRSTLENTSIFGKAAEAETALNAIESESIQAETKLRASRAFDFPKRETGNWWETLPTLKVDVLKRAATTSDGYAGEKLLLQFKTYLDLRSKLATTAAEHFGTPKLRAAAERFNNLTEAMGYTLADMESAVSAKALHTRNTGGQGAAPVESMLRAGSALAGGAAGSMLAEPTMGGLLGYGVGTAGGMAFNGLKRQNAIYTAEQIARRRVATAMSEAENAARQRKAKFQTAAEKMLVGKGGAVAPAGTTAAQQAAVASALTQAAANPGRTAQAVLNALGGAAASLPKISAMVGSKMVAMIDHLTKTLPPSRPPNNLLQPQFDGNRAPSGMAGRQWGRRLDAALYPEQVIYKPSREGVDTLKTLYPQTYAEIQSVMLDAMSFHAKQVPFAVRQKYALMLDLPTDAVQDPRRWKDFQNAQPSPAAQPKQPSSPKKPLNTAKSAVPMTDKLEAS